MAVSTPETVQMPSKRIGIAAAIILALDGLSGLTRGLPTISGIDDLVFLWGPNAVLAVVVAVVIALTSLYPDRAIAGASRINCVSPATQPVELRGPRGFPYRPMSLVYALLFMVALMPAAGVLSAATYLLIPETHWAVPIFLVRGLAGCVALVSFARLTRVALAPIQNPNSSAAYHHDTKPLNKEHHP